MIRLRALAPALVACFAVLLVAGAPGADASITAATLEEPPEAEAVIPGSRIPLSGTFGVDRGEREIQGGVRRDVPDSPTEQFVIRTFNGDRFAVQTAETLYNGRYLVDLVYVNSNAGTFSGCRDQRCTQRFTRYVRLAAPPADPADVAVSYAEKERKVTVTWDEAPELDIKGWKVRRSVDGGEPADVAAVTPTETPSYLDADLPDAGGKLEYTVIAVRAGDTDKTTTESKPVTKAVTVKPRPPDAPPPSRPGSPSTTLSPFGPVVTAPPVPTTKPRPNVTANVGAFANGLNAPPGKPTRSTLADGTFEELLPYDVSEELEPGEEGAGPLFKEPSAGEIADTLSFVFYAAAASMAFVVAMHVLFLLRQVKRADAAEALPMLEPAMAGAPLAGPALASTADGVEQRPRRTPRVAKRIGSDDPPPARRRTPRKVR